MLNYLTSRLFVLLTVALVTFTPIATHAKKSQSEQLEPPVFSHQSGFYPEEFELTISHPDPEAIIYYTLDGSDPDPSNLEGSTFRYKNNYAQPPATEPADKFLYQEYKTYKYTGPIQIKDRTYEPDRTSQISTTYDRNPDYFPRPERAVKESFYNKLVAWTNKIIFHLNNTRNHLGRIWHNWRTGEKKSLDYKIYIRKH